MVEQRRLEGEEYDGAEKQIPLRKRNCVRDDTVPFIAKLSFDVKGSPLGLIT